MPIDINKIIMESTQQCEDIQEGCKSKKTTKKKVILKEENLTEGCKSKKKKVKTIAETLMPSIQTSIGAGMGALILRSKLRTINEFDLSDIGDALSSGASKIGKMITPDTLTDKAIKGVAGGVKGAANMISNNTDVVKGALAGAVAVPVGSN